MEFTLSEEQLQYKDMVGQFVDEQVIPFISEYDRKQNPKGSVPWLILEKAMQLGLFGISTPQEYGGSALSNVEILSIVEELARGDSGIAYTMLSTITGAKLISQFGTGEQKEKWLRRISSEQTTPFLIGLAISEPQSGCDNMSPDPNAGLLTTAELVNDQYILNGSKSYITNAGIANLYIVWARTDKSKGAPQGGLSAFLVPADTKGLTVGKIEDKMGNRLAQQGELFFDNCAIPKGSLLSEEGQGFPVILKFVENRLPAVGAIGTGIASAAFNVAYQYAKQRVQGGTQIINHQAIAHKLSNMLMYTEASRLLYQKAAANQDQGKPEVMEAQMCKIMGSETAVMATNETIQILGCYGYSKEYPAEKLLRDARVFTVCENGNEFMRNKIIQRYQKKEEQSQ
ncbi:MAG: acyl-CoA dehydrogenase family protein [Oscillospiraceae bacterium]|nr:acyl-CoA dehydrogenase family protein [Oscillospiraceae bacterium]